MSTIKSSAENLTLNADGANNDVIIQSNGSTKVTVDGQNSRVGIGTTTPSAALEVKNTTDGTTFAFQATNDNDHEIVQVGAQADGDGYLTVHGQGASTNIKVLLHSDAESHISGGDLKIGSGDIYFGTAGKGIVLGATTNVDANTLDDYEEGTWTPTTASGWASLTLDGTGSYTKIGNIVHVMLQAHVDGSGAGSGHISIGGLPFTSVNTADYRSAISIFAYNLASSVNTYVSGHVEINSTLIQIFEGGLTSSGNDMGAHFDTGSSFYLQATYRV